MASGRHSGRIGRALLIVAACGLLPAFGIAGTVGYWRFEPDAFLDDSSGGGHALSNLGNMTQIALPASGSGSKFPSTVPQSGLANTRIADFTAASLLSGFTAADSAALGTIASNGAFTVEAFINSGTIAASGDEDARYIAAQSDGLGNQRSWSWQINTSEGFTLFLSGNGTGSFSVSSNTGLIAANKDYYVAVAYNASATSATFYWQNLTDNGTLQSQTVSGGPATLFNSAANFSIGYRPDSTKRWNNGGAIDEVRVSDTVLGPSALLITAPNQVPPTPQNLTATPSAGYAMNLVWSPSLGASGYTLYRDMVPFANITQTAHTDTGLAANTTYSYRVSARNANGESALSPPVNATASNPVTVSWNFEHGSMKNYTVTGNTVTLTPRTYPFNGQTTAWWNYFRVDGVAGRTLTFKYNTSGLTLHGHLSATRYLVSYDQQTWSIVNSTSGSGNNYQFTHTFTQDTAWIAYNHPYPVSRVISKLSDWSVSPFVTPTASADPFFRLRHTGNGTVWLGPGGTNEVGFIIPPQPLYAFKIRDPLAPGTKKRVVLVAGNHAGEPTGNHALEGLVEWLIGEAPLAVAVRQTTDFYVYPMADPEGRYGGYSRCNQLLPNGDHNREWDIASNGTLPEVDRLQEAIVADAGTGIDFFLDLHNQELPNEHYIFVNDGWQNTPFIQGLVSRISPFALEISFTWDTQVAKSWAKTSADGPLALNSFTMEPGSFPTADADLYREVGRSIGGAFFDALATNPAYWQWAVAQGLSGDGSLPLADPDLDALPNLAEKALGKPGTIPDPAAAPTLLTADGTTRFSYLQPVGGTGSVGDDYTAGGLVWIIEWSADLLVWKRPAEGAGIALLERTDLHDGTERVTFQLASGYPKAFVRMRWRIPS